MTLDVSIDPNETSVPSNVDSFYCTFANNGKNVYVLVNENNDLIIQNCMGFEIYSIKTTEELLDYLKTNQVNSVTLREEFFIFNDEMFFNLKNQCLSSANANLDSSDENTIDTSLEYRTTLRNLQKSESAYKKLEDAVKQWNTFKIKFILSNYYSDDLIQFILDNIRFLHPSKARELLGLIVATLFERESVNFDLYKRVFKLTDSLDNWIFLHDEFSVDIVSFGDCFSVESSEDGLSRVLSKVVYDLIDTHMFGLFEKLKSKFSDRLSDIVFEVLADDESVPLLDNETFSFLYEFFKGSDYFNDFVRASIRKIQNLDFLGTFEIPDTERNLFLLRKIQSMLSNDSISVGTIKPMALLMHFIKHEYDLKDVMLLSQIYSNEISVDRIYIEYIKQRASLVPSLDVVPSSLNEYSLIELNLWFEQRINYEISILLNGKPFIEYSSECKAVENLLSNYLEIFKIFTSSSKTFKRFFGVNLLLKEAKILNPISDIKEEKFQFLYSQNSLKDLMFQKSYLLQIMDLDYIDFSLLLLSVVNESSLYSFDDVKFFVEFVLDMTENQNNPNFDQLATFYYSYLIDNDNFNLNVRIYFRDLSMFSRLLIALNVYSKTEDHFQNDSEDWFHLLGFNHKEFMTSLLKWNDVKTPCKQLLLDKNTLSYNLMKLSEASKDSYELQLRMMDSEFKKNIHGLIRNYLNNGNANPVLLFSLFNQVKDPKFVYQLLKDNSYNKVNLFLITWLVCKTNSSLKVDLEWHLRNYKWLIILEKYDIRNTAGEDLGKNQSRLQEILTALYIKAEKENKLEYLSEFANDFNLSEDECCLEVLSMLFRSHTGDDFDEIYAVFHHLWINLNPPKEKILQEMQEWGQSLDKNNYSLIQIFFDLIRYVEPSDPIAQKAKLVLDILKEFHLKYFKKIPYHDLCFELNKTLEQYVAFDNYQTLLPIVHILEGNVDHYYKILVSNMLKARDSFSDVRLIFLKIKNLDICLDIYDLCVNSEYLNLSDKLLCSKNALTILKKIDNKQKYKFYTLLHTKLTIRITLGNFIDSHLDKLIETYFDGKRKQDELEYYFVKDVYFRLFKRIIAEESIINLINDILIYFDLNMSSFMTFLVDMFCSQKEREFVPIAYLLRHQSLNQYLNQIVHSKIQKVNIAMRNQALKLIVSSSEEPGSKEKYKTMKYLEECSSLRIDLSLNEFEALDKLDFCKGLLLSKQKSEEVMKFCVQILFDFQLISNPETIDTIQPGELLLVECINEIKDYKFLKRNCWIKLVSDRERYAGFMVRRRREFQEYVIKALDNEIFDYSFMRDLMIIISEWPLFPEMFRTLTEGVKVQ